MLTAPSLTQRQLRGAGVGDVFRPQDLKALGISYRDLTRLVEAGVVERVARGLYRLVAGELSQHHTLAEVGARVPGGIVCLLTALSVHEIGTQLPRQVWLAIPHKARAPRLAEFPVRLIRFSGAGLRYGVAQMEFEGVPINITGIARTVIDCFRFQRLLGRDVALEALHDVLTHQRATRGELRRAAEMCRARSLVLPHLEASAF